MKLFRQSIAIENENDASLVMYSLGGNRDAFCEIVTRYQTLLCSIAYSAVGDIKYSEDLAQEAFVEAWKKLDTLNDPGKLKSWLCGILRFKVSHFHRKATNQPVDGAVELEQDASIESSGSDTESAAIDEQQQALLWSALDAMEPTYREPLILFYREQQSVERVAAELDLSEDNVKQRLSRGRKILKRAMSTFVEEALSKSKPGTAFTAAVLSAISGISPPAKAAAIGAGAVKTGTSFNLTALLAFMATFAGVISTYFGLRASLDQSRTQRERQLTIKVVSMFVAISVLFVVFIFGLRYLGINQPANTIFYMVLSQILVIAYALAHLLLTSRMFSAMKTLRAHERIFEPQAFTAPQHQEGSSRREYISKLRLFGVPLCHFQFGTPEFSDKPVFAWFAGGSYAKGLVFAWGGIAIAPVSVGIIAYGVIPVGAVGIGIFSLGAVALGFLSFGAAAIGYKAYSSMSAMGWESAFSNGFSIAVEGAIGPIAIAREINNERAAELVDLQIFAQTYHWLLLFIAVFVIVPSIWHARKVRQRMR